jgi:hypothetical protein
MFLGPFCIPLLILIAGRRLPHNLLFWGDSLYSSLHALEYAIYATAIATYAFTLSEYGLNTIVYFYGEFVFLLAAQANRVTMLAIKYATFNPQYIAQLRIENLT